jgi:membrane-associated protease RseP (regulator of RpoE activity)
VLLRLTNMRRVDLDVFDFDYDLTWMAFFVSAEEKVYGRYGGRTAESPDSRVSLAGLRRAMEAALAAHRRDGPGQLRLRVGEPNTVDRLAAAKRLPEKACIHCHQVYDFRREELQKAGRWRTEEVWVYPQPENVGLTADVEDGRLIRKVADGSAAARLGLRPGDRVMRIGEVPTVSFADVQYGLHRAPASGEVAVAWLRDGREQTGRLFLGEGWRKTDISWRWSLRGLDPSPWVHGDDLTAAERKALNLGDKRLALRQGPYVSDPATRAGIRQNDVIIGVDGKELEMTGRQFGAFIRLNYKVGDRVTYNLLRDGKRLDATVTLEGRGP